MLDVKIIFLPPHLCTRNHFFLQLDFLSRGPRVRAAQLDAHARRQLHRSSGHKIRKSGLLRVGLVPVLHRHPTVDRPLADYLREGIYMSVYACFQTGEFGILDLFLVYNYVCIQRHALCLRSFLRCAT